MTRVIADPTLPARVRETGGMLEVCDENGRILGYYQPADTVKSPFTREELERRRQEQGGFTLDEIMSQLQRS